MPTDPALIQLLLSEFQTQNLGSLSSAAMNDRYEAFVWLLANQGGSGRRSHSGPTERWRPTGQCARA